MMIVEKYNQRVTLADSLCCVGLDSDIRKIPEKFQGDPTPQFSFNTWLIEQTNTFVSSYKMNTAFYEARGEQGWRELYMTVRYIRDQHPDILTICDAKRGDIGTTNEGYVQAIFDTLGFDAVTLHPYMGRESLQPFLDRADKASIVLCRTSNAGAGELQDLEVNGMPLWSVVAERVTSHWNKNNNCMLVVGATYPEEMKRIREITGMMPFLVPGIGVQGGDVQATVEAGQTADGGGLLIHSARGIIFSDNPAAEAQKLRDEINRYRKN